MKLRKRLGALIWRMTVLLALLPCASASGQGPLFPGPITGPLETLVSVDLSERVTVSADGSMTIALSHEVHPYAPVFDLYYATFQEWEPLSESRARFEDSVDTYLAHVYGRFPAHSVRPLQGAQSLGSGLANPSSAVEFSASAVSLALSRDIGSTVTLAQSGTALVLHVAQSDLRGYMIERCTALVLEGLYLSTLDGSHANTTRTVREFVFPVGTTINNATAIAGRVWSAKAGDSISVRAGLAVSANTVTYTETVTVQSAPPTREELAAFGQQFQGLGSFEIDYTPPGGVTPSLRALAELNGASEVFSLWGIPTGLHAQWEDEVSFDACRSIGELGTICAYPRFGIGLDFQVDIDPTDPLLRFSLSMSPSITPTANLKAEPCSNLTAAERLWSHTWRQTFTIWIVPVWIDYTLSLDGILELSANARLEASASVGLGFSTKIGFEASYHAISPIKEFEFDPLRPAASVFASGSASAKAGIKGTFSAMLYSCAGLEGSIYPYAKLDTAVKTDNQPCATYNLGAGLKVDFGVATGGWLPDWHKTYPVCDERETEVHVKSGTWGQECVGQGSVVNLPNARSAFSPSLAWGPSSDEVSIAWVGAGTDQGNRGIFVASSRNLEVFSPPHFMSIPEPECAPAASPVLQAFTGPDSASHYELYWAATNGTLFYVDVPSHDLGTAFATRDQVATQGGPEVRAMTGTGPAVDDVCFAEASRMCGRTCLAYTATDNVVHLVMRDPDTQLWSHCGTFPDARSLFTPAVGQYGGGLYVAWVDMANRLRVVGCRDGRTFFPVPVNEYSDAPPAIGVLSLELVLAWRSPDGRLHFARYSDGGFGANQEILEGRNSLQGPVFIQTQWRDGGFCAWTNSSTGILWADWLDL